MCFCCNFIKWGKFSHQITLLLKVCMSWVCYCAQEVHIKRQNFPFNFLHHPIFFSFAFVFFFFFFYFVLCQVKLQSTRNIFRCIFIFINFRSLSFSIKGRRWWWWWKVFTIERTNLFSILFYFYRKVFHEI